MTVQGDDRSTLPRAAPGTDRLLSWKEIAAHLGVSVRTAQRWERGEQLPVRHHVHRQLSSPYAFRSELDAWFASRPEVRRTRVRGHLVRSLAVLPFASLDRDPHTEILADGLTEALINDLARLPDLRVVARTSVMRFKGIGADIRDVGSRLGADAVLEGSLQQASGRLRVTAQLIDVATGFHVWSDRFERDDSDVFELQDDFAHAIVGTLRGITHTGMSGPGLTASPDRGTRYEAYLEGRHHWNTRTPAGYLKAVEYFTRLVREDDRMAPAWAALAECHALAHGVTTAVRAESRDVAIAAARRALDIDPALAEAHVVLGFIGAAHDFDWCGAEAHFRTALDLKPGLAFGHLLYSGLVLAPMGRLDQAAAHQARAEVLDPMSAVVVSATGMMRLAERKHDLAASAFCAALDLDPTYPWAHRGLGEVHLLQGRHAEAVRSLTAVEMTTLAGGFLGCACVRLGRVAEARQLLRRMEASGPPTPSCQVAALHLGLDDPAGALDWLDRAWAERSVGISWLKVDPFWDPLRGEPRFRHLLDTMGVGAD